jgi:hypothetical protein
MTPSNESGAGLTADERDILVGALADAGVIHPGAHRNIRGQVERIVAGRLAGWHPPHGGDEDCGPCLADYDRGFADGREVGMHFYRPTLNLKAAHDATAEASLADVGKDIQEALDAHRKRGGR